MVGWLVGWLLCWVGGCRRNCRRRSTTAALTAAACIGDATRAAGQRAAMPSDCNCASDTPGPPPDVVGRPRADAAAARSARRARQPSQLTDRERSSRQVCCPCSRAPRAARREAQSATPTAAQVRFLPSEAGPAHTSSTLSHARPSSHLTATILLTPPLPSLASLAGSRRAGRRRATTSCSTALASQWAAAHDFGRLRCVRCERVVHARACMLAHACPHLRARAARRSCLCRVGANCTGSVTCTVVVKLKVHVKQGDSTSFQHQNFDSRACFGRQTTPERNNCRCWDPT